MSTVFAIELCVFKILTFFFVLNLLTLKANPTRGRKTYLYLKKIVDSILRHSYVFFTCF